MLGRTDFTSHEDRFTCNFPGQPTVEEASYRSEYGADLPARVYSADDVQSRYSVTVVDYSDLRARILTSSGCDTDPEACRGRAAALELRVQQDRAGAITYATGQLIEGRDVKVTKLISGWMDRVEGHFLQFTDSVDGSRTYASIFMHEDKLYIMEGTVPAGSSEPMLFQQSLGWIDENGAEIRYSGLYRNGYPAPSRDE